MKRVLTAAILFGATIGVAVADDEVNKALKEMEGTYALKSMTQGGQSAPDEVLKSFKEMVIKDGTITTRWKDREESGTISIDPTKKPGYFDLEPKTGEEKGLILKGIYKFEKGTLTISFAGMGEERPKDFKVKGDETQLEIVFQKKEKEK